MYVTLISEKEASSFLTTHQHIKRYSVS